MSVALEHARKHPYVKHNAACDSIAKFGRQAEHPSGMPQSNIDTERKRPAMLAGMFGLRWKTSVWEKTRWHCRAIAVSSSARGKEVVGMAHIRFCDLRYNCVSMMLAGLG